MEAFGLSCGNEDCQATIDETTAIQNDGICDSCHSKYHGQIPDGDFGITEFFPNEEKEN